MASERPALAGVLFTLDEVKSLTRLDDAQLRCLLRLVLVVPDCGPAEPNPEAELAPCDAAAIWLAALLGEVGLGGHESRFLLVNVLYNELIEADLTSEIECWTCDVYDRRWVEFPGIKSGLRFDLEIGTLRPCPAGPGAHWVERLTYDVASLYRRNARALLAQRGGKDARSTRRAN